MRYWTDVWFIVCVMGPAPVINLQGKFVYESFIHNASNLYVCYSVLYGVVVKVVMAV
jgi:hypothetical protein